VPSLFAFFLVFFAIALVLPTVRVWRQTGRNPVVLPQSDDVAGFVGKYFKLLIIFLGVYLLLGALNVVRIIGQISLPEYAWIVGWCVLSASIFWVVIAQFQMGGSWRVGIDTEMKTALVVHGLFQFSRNPIFLGMIMQLGGLFLAQPDAITFTILVTGYILISIQIRGEEQHLMDMHGITYREYCSKVRRWI
jgi:protein-S-isoprenylcysteine O-methyltransferase Ste14